LEIPSPVSDRILELRIAVGDKVSQGTVISTVEAAADRAPSSAAPPGEAGPSVSSPSPAAAAAQSPAGAASPAPAFRAADLGMKVVLVERYATLGGVCLNVGYIPSKALLHVAAVVDEARSMAAHGIEFGKPKVDLDGLRGWKSKVVGKLTSGFTGMAKARKVELIRGYGRFVDAHHLEVGACRS